MRFIWWEDAYIAARQAAAHTGRRMVVYRFDGRWCVSPRDVRCSMCDQTKATYPGGKGTYCPTCDRRPAEVGA